MSPEMLFRGSGARKLCVDVRVIPLQSFYGPKKGLLSFFQPLPFQVLLSPTHQTLMTLQWSWGQFCIQVSLKDALPLCEDSEGRAGMRLIWESLIHTF